MENTGQKMRKALAAAFPYTVPILTGFLFLGMTYGIYMRSMGFSFLYPMAMSIAVFAGSAEFVVGHMLTGLFDPLGAFAMILMVNARHLFYGISMLDKYRRLGWKSLYLIYGMCDESFSINCTVAIPAGVDPGWFYFFITALNQLYWVLGATLGGLFGSLIHFNTQGLDFVMTAMFVVIFLEQWRKEKTHDSALLGIGSSALCLLVFGQDRFIIPAMALILLSLTLLRRPIEGRTTA
ncbi:MAG: AzlC family ABC transporter permease [Clostridia bacterium]|nr:AzlC family ABC transporter permease [Clostridia bacterium]